MPGRTFSTHLGFVLTLITSCLLSACGDSSSTQPGRFIDSPVSGLRYSTDTLGSRTPKGKIRVTVDGYFQYHAGDNVSFSFGTIKLGEGKGAPIMTPLDLTPGASDLTDPAPTNMTRLLQSLDGDANAANGIQIPFNLTHTELKQQLDFSQPAAQFEADPAVAQVLATAGKSELIDAIEAQQHYYDSVCSSFPEELKGTALLTATGGTEPLVAVHTDGSELTILPGDAGRGEQHHIRFSLASGEVIAIATDSNGLPVRALVDNIQFIFANHTGASVDAAAARDNITIGADRIELTPAGQAFHAMITDPSAPTSAAFVSGGGTVAAAAMKKAVAGLGLVREMLAALEIATGMADLSTGGEPFVTETVSQTVVTTVPGYTIPGGYTDWSGWTVIATTQATGFVYTKYIQDLANYRRSIGEPTPEGYSSHEQAIFWEVRDCGVQEDGCRILLPWAGGEGFGCTTTDTQSCRQTVYLVDLFYDSVRMEWVGIEETVTDQRTRTREPDIVVPDSTTTTYVDYEKYLSGNTGWGYSNWLEDDPGLQLWLRGFRHAADFNNDFALAEETVLSTPTCSGQLDAAACADNMLLATDIFTPASAQETLWLDTTIAGDMAAARAGKAMLAKPPVVRIIAPNDGTSFASGAVINLSGTAFDAEDGTVSNLSWHSDIDGALGTGAALSISGISEGQHVITLRGVDSSGELSEAKVSIGYGDAWLSPAGVFSFGCN